MAHSHERRHKHREKAVLASRRLRTAFVLTVLILAVEILGGLLSNSLALLSDAGHVFTDLLALGLAWFASVQATRSATPSRTFGFHRAGILAALANAVTLLAVSLVITFEAIQRLQSPQHVDSTVMLVAAAIGLIVNVYVVVSIHQGHEENLNVRSALLHVVGDALASFAVIVGAVVIMATGVLVVDPILSVLIALVIVGGAWSVVSETINILMEGTPSGIDVNRLTHDIKATPGILDAHDLHVWSIASGMHAMSGHVVVEDQALSESALVLGLLSELLADRYGIDHVTIQFEHRKCGLACTLAEGHLES